MTKVVVNEDVYYLLKWKLEQLQKIDKILSGIR